MAARMNMESPIARSPDPALLEQQLREALRGAAREDIASLRRLYDLMAAPLHGRLLQMLGDPEHAEPALQEAFLRIWQQASLFNPLRHRPAIWLQSMARQLAIDSLRSRRDPDADETSAALRLADSALRTGEADSLRILRLAYETGRTPAEIAAALGMSITAARRELHRALLKFRAAETVPKQSRVPDCLAGGYVVGSLSQRLRQRFEAGMEADVLVYRAWQNWEEQLAGIGPECLPVRPPSSTWTAIQSRIAGRAPRGLRSLRSLWLIAAAVVAALGVALLWKRL